MTDRKMIKEQDFKQIDFLFYRQSRQNLIFLIQLLRVTCEIFSVLKKFYQKPFLEIFLCDQNIFLRHLLKIRCYIKIMIPYLSKTNYILKITNQFLNHFNYYVLDSEVKIGKVKKFVHLILKTRYLNLRNKILEEVYTPKSNKICKSSFNFQSQEKPCLYYLKKKDQPKSTREKFCFQESKSNSPVSFSLMKSKNFSVFKIEVTLFFEKKLIEILLIRTKINKFGKIIRIFSTKSKKGLFSFRIDPVFPFIKKKSLKVTKEKKVSVNKDFRNKFFTPVGIKNTALFFKINFSKQSLLLFLVKSRFFKFYLKKRSPMNNDPFYSVSVIKPNKFIEQKKSRKKECFSFKNFNYKSIRIIKARELSRSSFLPRLFDLDNESHILWKKVNKDNLSDKKIERGDKKKIKTNKKFLEKFKDFDYHFRILFRSLYKKILVSNLLTVKEIKIRKTLCMKIQEFKSMEIDFQSFSEFFKKIKI